MVNIIRRCKAENVEFVDKSSYSCNENKLSGPHVFERGKHEGKFFISHPLDLKNMDDLYQLLDFLSNFVCYSDMVWKDETFTELQLYTKPISRSDAKEMIDCLWG